MTEQPSSATTHVGAIPTVAIGASAGGLSQIKLLLEHLPSDTGAAFVVLQHLDPNHESQLTTLLAPATDMPVVTIEDGMSVKADRVHVLPAGVRLSLGDNQLLRVTASKTREAHPTLIDGFFRDLATALGRRAVGIVLSGTGSDGALGLKAIRSAGGLAMAQNPDGAEFDGMPRAAAKYASPDCLLATPDLAVPLFGHLRHDLAGVPASDDEDADPITDQLLNQALAVLRANKQYDFRHHKPKMLKRRLHRRITLSGASNPETYLHTLQGDRTERDRLSKDFLISVTDFFREPESYVDLNQTAIRQIFHNRDADDPVRVWVPGCATGEEAFSIAILLAEAIKAGGRDHDFILFATDIDEAALAAARAGLYPESIAADLSAERLREFFDKVDEHYQIKRSLREHVVFAPQNVTEDPPYSRLDLISCRNLLIYFNADTQKNLIKLFHFALKNTGFLFLGSSETVGRQVDLFEPVSKAYRVFRRLAATRKYRLEFPPSHSAPAVPELDNTTSPPHRRAGASNAEEFVRNVLLREHVPASVLVNRRLEILFSYGPTWHYLSLPAGEPSLGLMEMVHSEYRSYLRAATHRAFHTGEPSHITAKLNGESGRTLLISARPFQQPEWMRGLVLLTFVPTPEGSVAPHGTEADDELQRQLAEELDSTRNELHSTISALEESNEDLKGSNEEVMSMNEELQSTNEELETSKEELQSVNEELTTVNTELEKKVEELESAHNDLSNLFAGTQVATLFLDRNLCIKRFTPAIRDLLNLISSDIGRPLRDMTLKFFDPELLQDADKVLDDLAPREVEVCSSDNQWYQRRIVPYRTYDNVIDGVVIIFVNVTHIRAAMVKAQESEERLDVAVSALNAGTWDMQIDPDAPDKLPENVFLSAELKRMLGFSDDEMANSLQAWLERILPEDRARFTTIARRHQSADGKPLNYRIRHRDGSIRWFASFGKTITDPLGRSTRWLGIDCDITERKAVERKADEIEAKLALLANAMPELVAYVDSKNVIRLANTAFKNQVGAGTDDPTGHSVIHALGKETFAALSGCVDAALTGNTASCDLSLVCRDNTTRPFHAVLVPHRQAAELAGYYLIITDPTPHARTELTADGAKRRLVYVHRLATLGEMTSSLAHDISQPLSAITGYASGLTRMLHRGAATDDTTPVVRNIAEQVQRAGDIVRDIRNFIGHPGRDYEFINPNQLIERAASLTRDRARSMGVKLDFTEDSSLPIIKGNTTQLEQVVVNLINNAMDAMEDTPRDRRTLSLATTHPDIATIQITVEDSGPGIPPDELAAVFRAFHSTKLDGMGMGLAIGRSIAEWHGGRLWVECEPTQGAKFHLTLPITPPEQPAHIPAPT